MENENKVETGITEANTSGQGITPATVANMQIGSKIASYEEVLKNEAKLRGEYREIKKRLEKLLRDAKLSYRENYVEYELVVKKSLPEDVDENLRYLGDYAGTFLTNFYNSVGVPIKLEAYIGKEAAQKIKEIVEYHNTTRIQETDYAATKALREAYPPLVEELENKQAELDIVVAQKAEAKEYVSYVKDLADIAKASSNNVVVNQS